MTVQTEVVVPATMNAAVVEGKGKFSVKQVPVKEPGYGEVLIKLYTCGVCHTDLHLVNFELPVAPPLPIIPGHEGAGIVAKVGPGCKSLKVGDRVGSAWLHDSCQSCEHCVGGWETVCAQQHQTGFMSDGCYAEYTIANEAFVGRIPDSMPFSQASPLLCAGVTAYKGLKETKAHAGQWVAIFGASGGLGHLAVQYGKAMGYKILAIDQGKERVEYTKTIGAKAAIDSSAGPVFEQIHQITNGGAHAAVVFAPSPAAYTDALYGVRARGVVVAISLPTEPLSVDVLPFALGAKTLVGSIVGTRQDLQECLELAEEANIKVEVAEDKLDNIKEILGKMEKRQIKGRVVLRLANE